MFVRRSLALTLLSQEKFVDALEVIEKAVSDKQKHELTTLPNARFALLQARAEILLAMGKAAGAYWDIDWSVIDSIAVEEQVAMHATRGKVLLALGEPDQALKAARLIERLAQRLESGEADYARALSNRISGAALMNLGKFEESLKPLSSSAEEIQRLFPDSPEAGEAAALYGENLMRLGRYREAFRQLDKASVDLRWLGREAVPLGTIAEMLARLGHCAEARSTFDLSIERATYRNLPPADHIGLHMDWGRAARDCNMSKDDVLANSKYTIDLIDNVTKVPLDIGPDDVAVWRRRYREIFEQYLAVLAETIPGSAEPVGRSRLSAAFETIQRPLSSGADLAIARAARRRSVTDAETAALSRQLDDLIEEDRENRIEDFKDDEFDLPLRSVVNQPGIQQRFELLRRLPNSEVEAEALPPVRLSVAKEALKTEEGLLIFSVGRYRGHVFVLTHDAAGIYAVNATAEDVHRDVDELLRAVSPEGVCPSLPNFPALLAYRLQRDWIEPAREFFRSRGVKGRITVVPDGDFGRLPLDMLLTEKPDGETIERDEANWYAAAPWLAREWAITVAPSVGAAVAFRQTSIERNGGPLFGMADPAFAARSKRSEADNRSMQRRAYNCLRANNSDPPTGAAAASHSLEDLPALGALAPILQQAASRRPTPSTIAFGSEATEAYLWQHRDAISSADVVFFGTHGFRGPQDLLGLDQPALALGQGGGEVDGLPSRVKVDGLLRADEITSLHLKASLVILAACNSAASDARTDDLTYSGLPRAFLAAGARNVVMANWMADASVANKMFSELIATTKTASPGDALRDARLLLIADPETAHPTNWAVFSLLGAP
jgi:CHAT domain-containing protein/tetratricopeptide (TPR) repeat protein